MEGCRRYLLLVASRQLDPDLKRKAGASDLVQETFHDAHRDFNKFRGESVQEFYAWLTGIMNHRMANHVRHFRALMRDVGRESPLDEDMRPISIPAQDLTPCRQAQLRDDSRQLREALARLPESLRVVIVLRSWDRETFVKIGDRLGISADAAHQRWTNAVSRLKQELRRPGNDR